MPLHVIYVEDSQRDFDGLDEAVRKANVDRPKWSEVKLTQVRHPSLLPTALSVYPDVVLADVYFLPEGSKPPAPDTDHLDDIIRHVREWDRQPDSQHGFPTPIIAYTSKGEGVLKDCLKRRSNLYDIWDKLSAGTDYVAWRFQQLAAELPRLRPDATMQRLIAAMDPGNTPPWHNFILKLVRQYGEGQTEREQIRECRNPIQSTIDRAVGDCAPALMELWDAMIYSEPLLRAASPRLRGIGRHSINVFWFGYWLINHPQLRAQWSFLWDSMLKQRAGLTSLKTPSVTPTVGLNAIWLLASLFHDAGKFHEFGKATTGRFSEFYGKFTALGMGRATWTAGKPDVLSERVKGVLHQLSANADDPMVMGLQAHILNCSKTEKPEHGTVAAAYLESTICASTKQPISKDYAREAARAMLLHSCLPAVMDKLLEDAPKDHLRLAWPSDPIACLLLFCDQVQTWDRHDQDGEKLDYPDRAELAYLDVEQGSDKTRPCLKGCIDYIAPSRVNMYPRLRQDIKEALNNVILNKPKKVLRQIISQDTWPFTVHLDCALSGEKLDIGMDFA